jgi:hypothetical protein
MDQPKTIPFLERLLEPVAQSLNADAARSLVGLRADRRVQARVDTLARKCNRGTLTEAERAEYESYVTVGEVIAILQARARYRLANPTG